VPACYQRPGRLFFRAPMNFTALTLLLFAVVLLAAVTDLRWHKIPNALTLPTMVVGIVGHTLADGLGGFLFSVGGLVLGLGALLGFYALGGMGCRGCEAVRGGGGNSGACGGNPGLFYDGRFRWSLRPWGDGPPRGPRRGCSADRLNREDFFPHGKGWDRVCWPKRLTTQIAVWPCHCLGYPDVPVLVLGRSRVKEVVSSKNLKVGGIS